jgi:hypothetical protein
MADERSDQGFVRRMVEAERTPSRFVNEEKAEFLPRRLVQSPQPSRLIRLEVCFVGCLTARSSGHLFQWLAVWQGVSGEL